MTRQWQQNIKQRNTWLRGLYMLLFWLIYNVAEVVVVAIALFQFIVTLLTGEVNKRILEFGQSLSVYVYQIWRFISFNTEVMPFPFSPWPNGDVEKSTLPSEGDPAKDI